MHFRHNTDKIDRFGMLCVVGRHKFRADLQLPFEFGNAFYGDGFSFFFLSVHLFHLHSAGFFGQEGERKVRILNVVAMI